MLSAGPRAQFVQYWTRIFGTVSMEVFGYLDWAGSDAVSVFDLMLRGIDDLGFTDAIADSG